MPETARVELVTGQDVYKPVQTDLASALKPFQYAKALRQLSKLCGISCQLAKRKKKEMKEDKHIFMGADLKG